MMFKGCEVCRLKTSPDRYCFYCERDREPVKARKKKRQRKQVMKYNPAEREAYLAYFRQLSRWEKRIVRDLIREAIIVTNSGMKGAIIAVPNSPEYKIGNKAFFNLVLKGYIYQENSYPFDYVYSGKELV